MDLSNLHPSPERKRELEKLLDQAHKNYLDGLENLVDAAGEDMETVLAREPLNAQELVEQYSRDASQLANDYYDTQRELWMEYGGVQFPDFDHTGLIDPDRVLWQQQGGFADTDFNGLTYTQTKSGRNRAGKTIRDLWPSFSDLDDAQQFIADMIGTSARLTTQRNIRIDPSKPRWARVPRGAKTCAFCTMLASRGFAYLSEDTAGRQMQYHHDCDCQIVPSWGEHSLEGYDPDEYLRMYDEANKATDGNDYREILKTMRRQNPDRIKDGVEPATRFKLQGEWLKTLASNGATASDLTKLKNLTQVQPRQLPDDMSYMDVFNKRFPGTTDSGALEDSLQASFDAMSLSEEEIHQINLFTGGDDGPMNAYLRTGQDPSVAHDLDQRSKTIRTALPKSSTQEDMVVYRIDSFGDHIEADKARKAGIAGKPFIKENFSSTTTNLNALIGDRDGEDDLFVIKVPKGSHSGAFIKSVSEYEDEHEFLINAGSAYRITDIIERPGERPVYLMELLP